MKLKLQWKAQEGRKARKNVEHLLREAACSQQIHPKGGAMWFAASKDVSTGLPKLFGAYILPQCSEGAEHGAFGFNVPAGFWLCFDPTLHFDSSILPF